MKKWIILLLIICKCPAKAQNVGIGTATPAEKLTVQTATNNFGIIHTDGVYQVGTYISNSIGPVFGTKSNHPLHFNASIIAAGEAPSMTILTNNNIGIGTRFPEARLHLSNGNNPTTFVMGQSHTTGSFTALYMGTSANTNGFAYLQSVRASGVAGGYGNLILNPTDGNVGIGYANPGVKLDVGGTARVSAPSPTEPALIVNGGIQVGGIMPAAFKVIANSSNMIGFDGLRASGIIVDNPLCNNDPNAMLFLTSVNRGYTKPYVWYDPDINKWTINIRTTDYTGFTTCFQLCGNNPEPVNLLGPAISGITNNSEFNVLVIKQ